MVCLQIFNLVILVALGERLVRAETETVEDEDGNLTLQDVEGSVRRKVSEF